MDGRGLMVESSSFESASCSSQRASVPVLELNLVVPARAELGLRALHLDLGGQALDLGGELASSAVAPARDYDRDPGRQIGEQVRDLRPARRREPATDREIAGVSLAARLPIADGVDGPLGDDQLLVGRFVAAGPDLG